MLLENRFTLTCRSNDFLGAYHLSEWTGWDERWIMVRVFPKSTNHPNEMALTICTSISRNCFRLMRDWKLESLANGKENFCRSIPNEKRGAPLKVLHNFRTEFPENYLTIWLQTKISGFSRQMVSTLCDILKAHLQSCCYSTLIGWC